MKEITNKLALNCDTATSGKEACELIEKKGTYDVYFIDLKMPEMNGIELSAHIKSKTNTNSIIIMISATEWASIENDAKKAGVDKFIPKPLFTSIIADTINQCLGYTGLPEKKADDYNNDGCFKGYKILLAEDVAVNREIVYALLESTLAEIDSAENGIEAVNMFEASPEKYSIILMDVHMPEMDGYEATKKIREFDNIYAKNIPIVAMTANVFKQDIDKCISSGMNDHIGKPLDFGEVIQKLRKYLLKNN
jgi:CheY-like chemotaxis protein